MYLPLGRLALARANPAKLQCSNLHWCTRIPHFNARQEAGARVEATFDGATKGVKHGGPRGNIWWLRRGVVSYKRAPLFLGSLEFFSESGSTIML